MVIMQVAHLQIATVFVCFGIDNYPGNNDYIRIYTSNWSIGRLREYKPYKQAWKGVFYTLEPSDKKPKLPSLHTIENKH